MHPLSRSQSELDDPNSVRSLRAQVIDGVLMRSPDPAAYSQALEAIPRDSFRRSMESNAQARSARFAGFSS